MLGKISILTLLFTFTISFAHAGKCRVLYATSAASGGPALDFNPGDTFKCDSSWFGAGSNKKCFLKKPSGYNKIANQGQTIKFGKRCKVHKAISARTRGRVKGKSKRARKK